MGRNPGGLDHYWPDRLVTLLITIRSIQEKQHTVSMRELEEACGVSRQTIANWLKVAAELGYVNLHGGKPRATELLAAGKRLVRRYEGLNDVKKWHVMREELRREYANQ